MYPNPPLLLQTLVSPNVTKLAEDFYVRHARPNEERTSKRGKKKKSRRDCSLLQPTSPFVPCGEQAPTYYAPRVFVSTTYIPHT